MADWVILCNLGAYDVHGAFNKLDTLDWKQSRNIEPGDTVYIYVGVPNSAICYKCEAIETELTECGIDDSEFVLDSTNYGDYGRYMRLHLLEKYDNPLLKREYLLLNGLKTVRGPSQVDSELITYINSVVHSNKEVAVDSNSLVIGGYIEKFSQQLPKLLQKEKKLEKLRQKFVEDYDVQKLMSMTKEEYVIGLDDKSTFCYRLENELQELGDIHGATSMKFGLYFGKNGNDTKEKYRWPKRFGAEAADADEVLKVIQKQIIFLRIHGEKKDLDAVRLCELSPMLRGKILSVYFPELYLCIFAEEHLNYFLKKLNIRVSSTDDIFDKQNKLIAWKKNHAEMDDWNNHIFSIFLYTSFGRPVDKRKYEKETQDARDSQYPRDYVTKINATVEQWKKLILDPEVFKEDDIKLLKRFYLADNHATTCYDLGIEDGINSSSYITPVVTLAKRISEALNVEPAIRENGTPAWWRIPFWGRQREDGHFEWKLRPKIAKAMAELYPELDASVDIIAEAQEDDNLVSSVKYVNVAVAEGFEYTGKPKEKEEPVISNGHKVYPRDRKTAINALAHADYKCEINSDHQTFIRKNSGKNYTEPHHLVPMAYQDEFEVSLDVEENIVSLCSNCHNQIHYGEGAEELIEKLYEERKAALESIGVVITLERLLEMYHYA